MTSLDLHPEELLDKAAAGALSDVERARLDQHLGACAVCRFELQARADFQVAAVGELDVDDVVARALSGLPVQPPAAAPRAARGARSARVLVAAGVLFTTMASFAAVATVTGVLPRVLARLAGPSERAAPPLPEQAPQRVAPSVERAAPAEVEVPTLPAPAIEAPPVADAARVAAARPRSAARPDQSQRPALPVAELPDAGALFARANLERVAGHRADAVRLYGELLEQFPGADEARVSEATLGRLLLDSGDPAAALVRLDAYLQSGDATLREEVLAARATALSRLNRPGDEAAAWSALLHSYPDSVHAVRARARLLELEGR